MSATTPETADIEALLAGELSRHGMSGHGRCRCGAWWTASDQYGNVDQFKAHLAAVLAAVLVPLVAQQRADALREAAAEIRRDHGVPIRRDANWSYRNGYFDGAMHAADVVKRRIARADRIAPTTEEQR